MEYSITLTPVRPEEHAAFCQNLQRAFAVAVIETFGPWDGGPIPATKTVMDSFEMPGAESWHILLDGEKAGGVIVNINKETQHNHVDLLFIDPARHSRGLGQAAWNAIEAKYPETRVWELITPYFEQRNIHFYVNKCGFHIVEFFNQYHPDPHLPESEAENNRAIPGTEAYFRFEKVMTEGT